MKIFYTFTGNIVMVMQGENHRQPESLNHVAVSCMSTKNHSHYPHIFFDFYDSLYVIIITSIHTN